MRLDVSQKAAIAAEAKRINVPAAHLEAVVAVESNGVVSAGLADARKPVIRWEGHYFDQRLTGRARDEARRLGLANPRAGGVKNPTSQANRYALLQRAVDFLKAHGLKTDAAYESCSWGIGQVMGSHWKALGYRTCNDFVATVISGFAGQLRVMVQFIVANGIDDELREGRWESFARRYNGPNYRKNNYHTKLKNAAMAAGGKIAGPDGFLRVGAKGAKVRELQALLVTAGYAIKVDSDFGPATNNALRAFQKRAGLTVDGVYGPQTARALSEFRVPEVQPGKLNPTEVTKVKEGVIGGTGIAAGVVAAKEALEEGIASLSPLAAGSELLQTISGLMVAGATVAALAGLAYAGYGWWQSKQTIEV